MTDIHSHILFDVDDGSRSVEESLILLKKMYNAGFDKVILTPHYIKGEIYNINNREKLRKLDILREAVNESGINIDIFLGNEIFINNDLIQDVKDGLCYTLNNTNYILFEIPFHNRILNLESWIQKIEDIGCKLILAHPERYVYFQKNHKLVDELKKYGLLFQANYGSILNYYGKEACNSLKINSFFQKNNFLLFVNIYKTLSKRTLKLKLLLIIC